MPKIATQEKSELVVIADDLLIEACDGRQTIWGNKQLFQWTERLFANCNEPGKATPNTRFTLCRKIWNASFQEITRSLEIPDQHKLDSTQHQIVQFFRNYSYLLDPNGLATFIPFRSDRRRYVASLGSHTEGGGGYANLRRFDDPTKWIERPRQFLFPTATK